MTREEVRKAAEVMMAYADGKDIEYTEGYGVYWKTTPHPVFDWAHFDYRIKQEPTYRPFKNKEECWDEMLKHQPFGWLKAKGSTSAVLIGNVYMGEEVRIVWARATGDTTSYSASKVFNNYVFADGTPFGIKEE